MVMRHEVMSHGLWVMGSWGHEVLGHGVMGHTKAQLAFICLIASIVQKGNVCTDVRTYRLSDFVTS